MAGLKQFLKSRQGLAFLAILTALVVGIGIGTIVQEGVLSAEKTHPVNQLKIQGKGAPLVLDEAVRLTEGFARVAQTIRAAVVNISTTALISASKRPPRENQEDNPFREFFGDDFLERFFGDVPRDRKVASLGSGVMVDSEGYLLTNYHVIRQADKIEVKLASGQTYVAAVIGEDPENDLAVLKVNAPKPLAYAKIGDSSRVEVGDWVLAVGSPFSFEQTVTAGIVSATHRVVDGIIPTGAFTDYIQTDAAINPGNSGGPLVNMRGEIVGINTFISTRSGGSEGIGFAIPSSVFVNSYNQIVTKGKIERGWLGVSMNRYPLTPEIASYFGVAGEDPKGIKDGDGVLITQLIDEKGDPGEGGPAYQAGIRPEDVIVKFGNHEVESNFDLRSAVARTPPGKSVPVTVIRHGRVLTLDVKLAERTLEKRQRAESEGLSLDEPEKPKRKKEIGLEVRTFTSQDASRLRIEEEKGVLILNVAPASLADEAELVRGQIITYVNGEAVETARQFVDTVNSMSSAEAIVVRVITIGRDGKKGVGFTAFSKP